MNSQVLINRKVLENLQERLDPHIDAVAWGAVYDALTAPIPDAGERLEVVGYLPVKTFCDDGEELMTVAQHNRIVSALQASALVVPDKRTSCAFCGKRQPETTSQGDK